MKLTFRFFVFKFLLFLLVDRKKINIIILALFHLLVFVFPYTIKDIHHHETHYLHILYQATDGKLVSKAEKPCPICQFEFVNFIRKDSFKYCIYQLANFLKDSEIVPQSYSIAFTSFLHRAPPLS